MGVAIQNGPSHPKGFTGLTGDDDYPDIWRRILPRKIKSAVHGIILSIRSSYGCTTPYRGHVLSQQKPWSHASRYLPEGLSIAHDWGFLSLGVLWKRAFVLRPAPPFPSPNLHTLPMLLFHPMTVRRNTMILPDRKEIDIGLCAEQRSHSLWHA